MKFICTCALRGAISTVHEIYLYMCTQGGSSYLLNILHHYLLKQNKIIFENFEEKNPKIWQFLTCSKKSYEESVPKNTKIKFRNPTLPPTGAPSRPHR